MSHTRRYIHRTAGKTEETERNANFPATVLIGSQTDFDYDAFAELTFAEAGAFQTFFGLCQQPENAARIAADEEQFLDRSRSKSSSALKAPSCSKFRDFGLAFKNVLTGLQVTVVVLGETVSTTK